MSAGRFKSKDDYFSRRSGLAGQVISAKTQPLSKPGRKRALENSVPAALLRVHFCKTVDSFEITGRGRFLKGDYPLDDALQNHLDGDRTMLVNPLSGSGETAFTVVRFDLSEEMDHPFSKAKQYADELQKFGIPSLVEVTEGGKGHYHLWIFHEQPLAAEPFSEALVRLGHKLFGVYLETVPPVSGDAYIPLPLQGESVLLQRRVFVNAVGKMIREQASVLRNIETCPKQISDSFVERMTAAPKPAAFPRPAPPVVERKEVSSAPLSPVSGAPSSDAEAPPKTAVPVDAPRIEPPKTATRAVEPPVSVSPAAGAVPGKTDAAMKKDTPAEEPGKTPKEAPKAEVRESSPRAADTRPEIGQTPRTSPGKQATAEKSAVSGAARVEAGVELPLVTVLVFRRNAVEYGVGVDFVETVIAKAGITPIPGAGEGICGVIKSGGRTVHVLDLKSPEDAAATDAADRGMVVVLKAESGNTGFLADGVSGISKLSGGAVAPFPADDRFSGAAVIPESDRTILLIDVERLSQNTAGIADSGKGTPMSAEPHVLFSVKGGRYALPAQSVREILPDTPVLGTERAAKEGVRVQYRGQSLAVVDFRNAGVSDGGAVIRDTRTAPSRRRIMVLRDGESLFGVRVDDVSGIRTLVHGEIEPSIGFGAYPVIAAGHPSGAGEPVLILDPGRMRTLPV